MKKVFCVMVLLGVSFMNGSFADDHELELDNLTRLEGLASEHHYCIVRGARSNHANHSFAQVYCGKELKFQRDNIRPNRFYRTWAEVMDTMIVKSGMKLDDCHYPTYTIHFCDFIKP